MAEITFEQKETISKKVLSILDGLSVEDAKFILVITEQSLAKNSCVKAEGVPRQGLQIVC